jgi:DNA/RNA endonuclease YhcR with UshA esterase domain
MGIRFALASGLLLLAAGTSVVVAQDKPAPHESYQYDTAKQQTVTGTVEAVNDYKCPVSGTVGTHITVKTSAGIMEVHLAPAKFVKDYDIVIHKGDQVEIQGAKIIFEGKPSMIAKTVAVDRTTFAFRDNSGKPLW